MLPGNYSCATPVTLCFPESDRATRFGKIPDGNVSEGPEAKPSVLQPAASLSQPPAAA